MDYVNPSPARVHDPYQTATAIRYGGLSDGWVAEADRAYIAQHVEGITGAPLDAYGATHSSDSLTVVIDSGEAFVGGAWLVRDTQTEVDLADNTANQTIYVGWAALASDTVLIGPDSVFDDHEYRLPIWEFSTNGTGVTSATDRRTLGPRIRVPNEVYDADRTGVVDQATNADHATTADSATNATNAQNAQHAVNAENATNAEHAETADHADTADYADEAGHAETADSATTADSTDTAGSATTATTAENATNFGGRAPEKYVRDAITINFPIAKLEPEDRYRQVEFVPSGTTLRLLSTMIMNDSFGTHSNLYLRIRNSSGSVIHSTTSKYSSGTLSNPLTTVSGNTNIMLSIENGSSSTTRNVGARLTYIND